MKSPTVASLVEFADGQTTAVPFLNENLARTWQHRHAGAVTFRGMVTLLSPDQATAVALAASGASPVAPAAAVPAGTTSENFDVVALGVLAALDEVEQIVRTKKAMFDQDVVERISTARRTIQALCKVADTVPVSGSLR